MRARIVQLLCRAMAILWLAALSAGQVRAERAYTFGVVPQFEPRKLSAIWAPILAELEKRTGLKFEMIGSSRIPEFEAEFMAGHYDFAYMNPYHAVVANRSAKYQPIVRDGSDALFGILVTAADNPMKGVGELNGKTVAFPAPNAFGASLLMRAELEQKYHVKVKPLWAQTHTSAYLNAALGKVDAAGGIMATLKQQPQDVQDRLRIIYETRRVAPHPIVAHPRVAAGDREKVRKALLEMGTTEAGQALLAAVPIRRVTSASFADYQELTRMGLDAYYVKGGD